MVNEEIGGGDIRNLRDKGGKGKWEEREIRKMGTLGVEKIEIVHNK
jgi:hypothetical protein